MFWVARRLGFDESKSWQLSRSGHSTSLGMRAMYVRGIQQLILWQRSQAWPAYGPQTVTKTLDLPHALADPRHNPPLPLHCAKPGQITWPRMS